MGRFFSDAVEQALNYIYYDLRGGQGQGGVPPAPTGGARRRCGRLLPFGPVSVQTGVHMARP